MNRKAGSDTQDWTSPLHFGQEEEGNSNLATGSEFYNGASNET